VSLLPLDSDDGVTEINLMDKYKPKTEQIDSSSLSCSPASVMNDPETIRAVSHEVNTIVTG